MKQICQDGPFKNLVCLRRASVGEFGPFSTRPGSFEDRSADTCCSAETRINRSRTNSNTFPSILSSSANNSHDPREDYMQSLVCRVAQEPSRNWKPEPLEPFFPKPKAEPEPPEPLGTETGTGTVPFLLNCTEIQKKNTFGRGTAGTENRNRLNHSISKP